MGNKFFYSEVTVKSPENRKTFVAPGVVDSSFKLLGEDEFHKFIMLHDEQTNVKVTSKIYSIGTGYVRKTFADDVADVIEFGKKFRRIHKQCDFALKVYPQAFDRAS